MRRAGRTPSQRDRPGLVRAFSLVELVIVVVIIGVIAAIAVPRFSRGVAGANEAYLRSSVATVRRAIEMYYAEHDRYPGYNPATGAPDGTAFVEQLLQYTDIDGNYNATQGSPFIYGPYLRSPFPENPINGLDTVQVLATPAQVATPGTSGWVATLSTGDFGINATQVQVQDLGILETGGLGPKGGGQFM